MPLKTNQEIIRCAIRKKQKTAQVSDVILYKLQNIPVQSDKITGPELTIV